MKTTGVGIYPACFRSFSCYHGYFIRLLQSFFLVISPACFTAFASFPCLFQNLFLLFFLLVSELLKFAPRPVSTQLELGSSSHIDCIAEGQAPPRVYWVRSGPSELPPHVQDEDGMLVFDEVLKEDEGRYTCYAESAQGRINATIIVTVVGKKALNI